LAYQGLSSQSTEDLSGVELGQRRVKRKRSKGLVILLLPALIFIGFMGWLMYTLSSPQKPKAQNKLKRKDNVTLLPIFGEEQEITAHNSISNR